MGGPSHQCLTIGRSYTAQLASPEFMVVWQGVAMDKVSPGPAMPYPPTPCRWASLQSGQPTAIFYPFGHPTPCAFAGMDKSLPRDRPKSKCQRRRDAGAFGGRYSGGFRPRGYEIVHLPCGWPNLKRLLGCLRNSRPQGIE
jgi:hypothetical protein